PPYPNYLLLRLPLYVHPLFFSLHHTPTTEIYTLSPTRRSSDLFKKFGYIRYALKRPTKLYPIRTAITLHKSVTFNVPLIACLNPVCAQYCGVMLPIFCKTSGIISKGIHNLPTRAPTNAIICVMEMPILFFRILT